MGSTTPLGLGTPAMYRITIQGCLSCSWSDHFGGMAISHETDAGGSPLSVLTGRLVDQAALFGVLSGVYNLGFPLLAVKCVEVNPVE